MSEVDFATPTAPSSAKRRRTDGERSRAAILEAAAQLATVEGLEGLSIGRLAEHLGMSKSGLYAHFGSKEELQLAAIDTAAAIVTAEVIVPAREAPTPLARLESLCEHFLSYLERRVFPGGCFFNAVAVELRSCPESVRTRFVEISRIWLDIIERRVRDAQESGELRADEDPTQLAFELNGMLKMGNAAFMLEPDAGGLERARRGFQSRLAAARA